jgi:hypothetical protein
VMIHLAHDAFWMLFILVCGLNCVRPIHRSSLPEPGNVFPKGAIPAFQGELHSWCVLWGFVRSGLVSPDDSDKGVRKFENLFHRVQVIETPLG